MHLLYPLLAVPMRVVGFLVSLAVAVRSLAQIGFRGMHRHPLSSLSRLVPRPARATWVGLALGAWGLLGIGLLPAHAQNPPTPPPPERPDQSAQQVAPSAPADSFELAQQQMSRGNYDAAIALLEQLTDAHPDRPTFRYELIDAYEETKAYDDALALLDRTIDTPSVSDLVDKGRLQHLAGREDEARQTWEDAIALHPERASTYRSVYHTLSSLRQFSAAIDVMERGREALDEPDAFQTELAHLYSLDGQHEAAMREYVDLLRNDERRVNFVRSRLQPFLDQSGDLGSAAPVLEEAVADHPDHEAYLDLLAWLYAEQEDYDAALDAYTRLDDLRNDEGETVLDLARQAADADNFDAAREALRTTQSQFEGTRAAQLAQKMAGDMAYRRWSQAEPFTPEATEAADDAWTTYRSAINSIADADDSPPEAYATVWMRLAELALEVRNDPDAAREAHAALDRFRGYETERTLLAGRIALHTNDVEAARAHFDSLAQEAPSSPPHRTARHRLAVLDLHDGQPERAQEHLDMLLSDFSHTTANDAVAWNAALRHFNGPDSTTVALQHYAHGTLREWQQRWAEADSAYATIENDMPQHPLAERARYQRARLAAHLDSPQASANALQDFAEQSPRHPWADRALFHAARLLDHAENQPSEARAVYMRLLDEHPDSVFASEARTRVRALPSS